MVGLQARAISPGPLREWAQGTWPGCYKGTPATGSHLLPQAPQYNYWSYRLTIQD